MPGDSISKRLAAKLKISGKARTSSNNLTKDARISDLVDRPFSAEQEKELERASNARQQIRPRIDNIQADRPSKGTSAVADRADIDPTEPHGGIQDYSLPPLSYARSQVADPQEESPETPHSLGAKESEDLQNANLYRPESAAAAKPSQSQQPEEPNKNNDTDKNSEQSSASKETKSNIKDKFNKEAIKKFASGIAKKIATNPATWPWIIAGSAILLALFIFAVMWGINYAKNSSSPSAAGKSLPIEVDPVADKEWVKKVLMLSGDKDVANVLKAESAAALKTNLGTIKTLIQSDSTIPATEKETYIASLNNLIEKVDEVSNAPDDRSKQKAVTELKNAINEFIKNLASISPLPTTLQTILPLKVTVTRFNSHPHLGTLGWPSTEKPKGYPSPARTYLQTGEGTCDAVDLKVGGNVGVYAAFPGKIVRQGGAWGVENDQNKVIAIYGHIDLNAGYSAGKEVKEGELFGKTQESQGHLHFELAVNKGNGWKCVASTKEEVTIQEKAGWPEHQLGKSLWEKMILVLHSPNSPE